MRYKVKALCYWRSQRWRPTEGDGFVEISGDVPPPKEYFEPVVEPDAPAKTERAKEASDGKANVGR